MVSLDEIEVSGDYPLEEVQEKTKNFEFCLERIDRYFGEDSNLSCTVGSFPEEHSPEYCWGGCPGALQEAIHIFRGFNPDVEKGMKKIRYVVGKVEGPLDLAEDERVMFVGDCTRWKGIIDGREINIESSYKNTGQVDTRKTKSNDMLLRNFRTLWNCFKNRSSRYIHAKGCTVPVSDIVHYLSSMGEIGNPNFDPRIVIPGNIAYWQMRFNRFMNQLWG